MNQTSKTELLKERFGNGNNIRQGKLGPWNTSKNTEDKREKS